MSAGPWCVPPMWSGRTVAVLASGASMSLQVAEQVRAAGVPAVVVNETFRLALWAPLLYAADADFWRARPEALAFGGHKVTASRSVESELVRVLQVDGAEGFTPDPTRIRTGGNGGFAALHIAMQAGARRVLLCGLDLRGEHWHGRHGAPLRNPTPELFGLWRAAFSSLVAPARERGVDVVNCSPGSALTCFRSGDLASELSRNG